MAGQLIESKLEELVSVLGLRGPSNTRQCTSYISSSHVDRTSRKCQEAQRDGTQLHVGGWRYINHSVKQR
jgi:hypothetical protein